MKINDNIEEYDVGDLNAIYATVSELRKMCSGLGESAAIMDQNIRLAEQDFTSENMARAKAVIKKYAKMLEDAEYELKDLAESVEDFAEKLRNAWREW